MPSGERRAPGPIDPAPDVNAELSSVNAVFTLSLILTQASSPVQLIRLVTTAIPSIAHCQRVLAWHPGQPGDYYERAPDGSESLTAEEIFLLSVLAQLCGTVIAKLELIAAERVNAAGSPS